jgi:hypothetical protein
MTMTRALAALGALGLRFELVPARVIAWSAQCPRCALLDDRAGLTLHMQESAPEARVTSYCESCGPDIPLLYLVGIEPSEDVERRTPLMAATRWAEQVGLVDGAGNAHDWAVMTALELRAENGAGQVLKQDVIDRYRQKVTP